MRVIYLDTLFLLNAAADLLCLIAAEKVCDRRIPRIRLAAGAVIGGIYALLSVLPGCLVLQNPIFFITAAVLITASAFGFRNILRPLISVFAVSAMLGGAVYFVSRFLDVSSLFSDGATMRVFLIALGISWGIFTFTFRRFGRKRNGRGILQTEVCFRGKSVCFSSLVDTGNSLRDPLTGSRVLVCDLKVLLPLFTEDERRVLLENADNPLVIPEKINSLTGKCFFRLVPYRAVGVTGGFLAAFKPDKLLYNGKEVQNPLVASTPCTVSDSGAYSALAGADAE